MVIKFDSTLGSKLTTLFNFKKNKKMEEMFLKFLEYCVTEDGGAYILVSAILLVVLLIFVILKVLLTPFMDKIEKFYEEDEE
ncbi:MAG: hypothetical protein MR346_03185 [Clostridium sp.]|nr:hypothetical protein [Clostridium sp.]